MYRLTIRIRSDDTIRPNTNTLFGPLFGTEANTKRIFGTSLVLWHNTELSLHNRDLVRIQCGCGLEGLSADGAGESTLQSVDGRMDFEVASIHERPATDLADMTAGIGSVATSVSSQQGDRTITPSTHLKYRHACNNWLTDRLGFNDAFSTNRLYHAFEKHLELKK